MIQLRRTTAIDKDFMGLVKELDSFLAVTDGDDHEFYDQYNKLNDIKHVVVAYQGDVAIACGAIKYMDDTAVEVKRMYTKNEYRGQGTATAVLQELERWAKELGYTICRLETGIRQHEAIALYFKNGYTNIINYGPYKNITASKCFEKKFI